MLYCLSSSRHIVPVVAVIQPSVGEWLSLVEHLVRDQGVGGSNPLSPTKFFEINSYEHTRFVLGAYFVGPRLYLPSRLLLRISDLGAAMSPWAKTRGSGGGPVEGAAPV
jgi:hypothetical protein